MKKQIRNLEINDSVIAIVDGKTFEFTVTHVDKTYVTLQHNSMLGESRNQTHNYFFKKSDIRIIDIKRRLKTLSEINKLSNKYKLFDLLNDAISCEMFKELHSEYKSDDIDLKESFNDTFYLKFLDDGSSEYLEVGTNKKYRFFLTESDCEKYNIKEKAFEKFILKMNKHREG